MEREQICNPHKTSGACLNSLNLHIMFNCECMYNIHTHTHTHAHVMYS